MSSRKVATPDGGYLAIYSFGEGPGVVFVEGSLTEAFVYSRFARSLARVVPVQVYDRRGRGGSSPQPANYTMDDEIDDLRTVLEATGSTAVVGHSYGGGIAIEAAIRLPIQLLVCYDAVVNVDGCVPTGFLQDLEAAVRRGQTARAVTVFARGITSQLRTRRAPEPALHVVVWIASLLTRKGRTWRGMMPTIVQEVSLVRGSHVSAARYSGITIPVLLMFGRDSDSFYRTIAQQISAVLSKGNAVGVPTSDHGALDRPSKELMDLFVDFLVGQTQRNH